MSYCRFSSDNWRSDVYCYASNNGYTTHVAGSRIAGNMPIVEWPKLGRTYPPNTPLADMDPHDQDEVLRFAEQHKMQMAFIDCAKHVPIDLPHAGDSFDDPDLESFRDRLLMLRELGYSVPQYVFDDIAEEIAERDTPEHERMP